MNNIMKLLTISAVSCAVIVNCEAQQSACVKPVQFICGVGCNFNQSKTNIKANIDQIKPYVTSNPNSGLVPELSKVVTFVSKDTLNKDINIKVDKGAQTKTGMKDGKINLYQIDVSPTGATEWINNTGDAMVPSLEVKDSNNGSNISVMLKNDWIGNNKAVPVNSKYEKYFYDNSGVFQQPASMTTTTGSVYDSEHPAPTITQQLTLTPSIDTNKHPGEFYEIKSNSDTNNSWTAKGWQFAGYAEAGFLINFSNGGSWYLVFFGSKPFSNSTQLASISTSEDSTSNNEKTGGINVKNKGTLGLETGLRCYPSEKIYISFGGGVQRSWNSLSLNNSGNNNSNNESNSETQNMTGTAPFLKCGIGVVVTKNIGMEFFAKGTAQHGLNTTTTKQSSDNKSSSSSNSDWPITASVSGSVSFGVTLKITV